MDYLHFEASDGGEAVTTLEAMAATPAALHPAVMAEVQQVLDWAWRAFPHGHGPVDEGLHWDHDLQVGVEPGDWHAVTLTLTGSQAFVEAFFEAFPEPDD